MKLTDTQSLLLLKDKYLALTSQASIKPDITYWVIIWEPWVT